MKNNKGITLMSLIVYIGVFLAVIGVIATISSFFYKNVAELDTNTTSDYEYNRLNLYLLEEVKKQNNGITRIIDEDEMKSVSFESGNTFLFQSNKIYYIQEHENTKILLCDKVKYLKFEKKVENAKDILHIEYIPGSVNEIKKDEHNNIIPTYQNDYVLNNLDI